MAEQIKIISDEVELTARLNDSPSAKALVQDLPLELQMTRWGDEYYGACGVSVEEGPDARELMEVGELAICPPAQLCVFSLALLQLAWRTSPERPRRSIPSGKSTPEPKP